MSSRLGKLFSIAVFAGAFAVPLGVSAAEHGPDQLQVLPPRDEKLADEITKEYGPNLRELVKPAYVYNYVKSDKVSADLIRSDNSDDPRVQAHLANTARYFWFSSELGADWSSNVPGLYAALDPFSSTEYGDVLFRIELPKGFRYLAVQMHEPFSRTNLALEHGGKQSFLLRSFLTPRNNHLANRVLQKLRVDGIFYTWNARTFSPRCGRNRTAAFVITDTRKIQKARMFSQQSIQSETPDSVYQERVMMSAVAGREHSHSSLFALDASSISDGEVRNWLNEHQFGCGGEDQWARPPTDR